MNDARPTDAELVTRCMSGEESAWVMLSSRYADLVFSVARRSGLDADAAGDVVQDVFVALLSYLGRLRRKDRLLPWILTTARRASWREVKRARTVAAREQLCSRPAVSTQPLPETALATLEEEQAVRAAFGRLRPRCRRLLDALFFQDEARSYAEIAEALGIPVGSLGPTRRRCLDALRRELAREGYPAPYQVSGRPVIASTPAKRTHP